MTVTKYSANGNDFIIYHSDKKEDRSEEAKKLCHRQKGVGADGLVVVIPHKDYDFEWDFYNSDGSYAAMCGNASRAVAHFAHEKGISKDGKAEFLTGAGVIRATINGLYVVSDMTKPNIIQTDIVENGKSWWLIDSGVPHLISFRDNIDEFDILEMRELRYKYDANVNIASINGNDIFVRTYERGVEGETLACGTGMVASFLQALELNLIDNSVYVYPKSGEELQIKQEDNKLYFKGKVTVEFTRDI